MAILCNEVKVFAVVVDFIYSDNVWMVDILQDLKFEEQLSLVLFFNFVFRNH